MKSFKLLAIAALVILTQGCVSMAKYTPMTKVNKDKIKTLHVYNYVGQDEIRPSVELSNVSGALGGGLIGAMIDSSVNDGRATDARSMLDEFYTTSLDFDYRQLSQNEFSPFLAEHFSISSEGVQTSPVVLTDKEIEQRAAQLGPDEGFLFLASDYAFVDSFKMLQTSVRAYLFVGGNPKPKVSKPDFHNIYVYQSPAIGAGGNDSISQWTENNAALFREQMKQSIWQSVESMKYEMDPLKGETCATSASFSLPTQMTTLKVSGVLIDKGERGSLVRAEDGRLYTVDSQQLKTQPNKKCKQEVMTNA